MLRHLLFAFFLLCLLGHNVHAALSPEYQQMKEKDAIRESKELKGRVIRSMFMYEEDGTRYYDVKADCTYQFVVNYHLNPLALLGWVGPKTFSVEMYGEPNCQDPVIEQSKPDDLKTTIFENISVIYDIPMDAIKPNMSLYHVPTNQEKLGMDFRILTLREHLDIESNCRIKNNSFMTIRTVSDLLTLVTKYCGSSK